MPLYEYKCRKCGMVSEILVQSGASGNEVSCPECGSKDLEKLLTAPAGIRTQESPSGAMSCGREQTCCGRAEPCAAPPCKK